MRTLYDVIRTWWYGCKEIKKLEQKPFDWNKLQDLPFITYTSDVASPVKFSPDKVIPITKSKKKVVTKKNKKTKKK